ncbi:MAG: M23 family metallopeptidase [Actinomycetia bacterium]|nr:M23 family metallopeptidase [Actinomycetes bacterium]
MSSRSYAGRHRVPGRHRAPRKLRLPRALSPAFALPTAAAATLVFTTTGATMAGSAPVELQTASIDLNVAQSQVSDTRSDTDALAERRSATTDQLALLQGRQQEDDRAARAQVREAIAEKREAVAEEKRLEEERRAEEERRKAAQTWVYPIAHGTFTSAYGPRWGRLHAGIDIAAPIGTPIYSVSSGTVVRISSAGGCGRQVYVEHWEGTVTRYCHMDYFSVSVGDRVSPGQKLGGSGNTGRSTGPHLHFEVMPGGLDTPQINPSGWMRDRGIGR